MKRLLLPLLIVGAIGGWFTWKHVHSQETTVYAFHGNVDIREVRLGFRVGGRVSEILKDEGDTIKPGETVAKLDSEPFQQAVSMAEAQVQRLAAKLQELKNGNRPEEIEQGRKRLDAAETTLENALQAYQRQQRLISAHAVPQQDLDNAQAAWRKAVADRDAAKANLDLLNAGTRTEEISQAAASLAEAEANLAQAKTQLGDTNLVAPEAGVVLTRAVEPGSIVQAGSSALTVSLRSPVWGRAYVAEPQLGLVFPGKDVLIYTDSRQLPYHGQVGDVSSRAEFTPKSVETEELRTALVYRFRVVIQDADQGLRQGMPITVRFPDVQNMTAPQNKTTGSDQEFELSPKVAEAASKPEKPEYRFKVVQELRMERTQEIPVATAKDAE